MLSIYGNVAWMSFWSVPKSGTYKLPGIVALYAVVFFLSHWLAVQIAFDFSVPALKGLEWDAQWPGILLSKLLILYLFGEFSSNLNYFSTPDLRRLFFALALSSVAVAFIRLEFYDVHTTRQSIDLIDLLLSFGCLASLRLLFRMHHEGAYFSPPKHEARKVGIIGAGDAGAKLARELHNKKMLGLKPVVFFDDDPGKWRSRVYNIPVIGPPEALLEAKFEYQLDEIIIAIPSAPTKRIGEIVKILHRSGLKFATVPSLDQLASGQVAVSQLRSVEIQDLLGRQPVKLETNNIRQILKGKVVLVTGAGGSIGSELCRQIASFQPEKLLLVDQSDEQVLQIEQELAEAGFGNILIPLMADILDIPCMQSIFERHRPAIVFHAAAHKHVPMMEMQPSEAIKNNTFGTARLCELALQYHVARFVLISTDKAINPTNVMGATKRLAEIFLQSIHAHNPDRTKFMAVRFGNVLGSSGSVIPIFNKQIAAGGPVKVTHPDVTRYFMTIPEAAGLVLQSAAQGSGGEIFVLDMGRPVKIVDLASQLIELSGLRPGTDIEIVFSGLRPGEKLFEELSHKGENITPTHHPKIMRFVSQPQPLVEVRRILESLRGQLHEHEAEPNQLKIMLKSAVPEYNPYLS